MRHLASMVVGMLALAIFLMPQPAEAGLDAVLGDIEWGDSKETVISKLRTSMLNELREDNRLRNDRVAMQRERQRVLDHIRRIEDSYTPLRGERTGFEVSVVAGEFATNNGESLLRVRDEFAQRYFFFHNGRLYRLVVAYEQSYVSNVGFEAFLNQASQRYGRPNSSQYGRVHGEEVLVKAIWQDGTNQLRVEDKREFFGTFTMTFSELSTANELRAAHQTDSGDSEAVSSRVRALMQDESQDPHSSIVDGIVGNVEVELPERQRREEEKEEEASERRPSSDRAAERQDRPQQQRQRPRQRTQPAASDDLVIY